MSIDGIAAILFILILAVFLWVKRKEVKVQGVFPFLYIVMYRSLFGLKLMKRFAERFPKTIRFLGYVGIIIGFAGMILICAQLIISTIQLFAGTAPPSIQPVLPFEAKGVFYVPFLYWIISIFSLALVHEFSHGIMSNAHKIPVQSSGFAFLCTLLPIIPAAFVEPGEKLLKKKPMKVQLSVFAAGPFSNILFALLMLGIVVASSPLFASAFDQTGVELVNVAENSSAFNAGLHSGDIITAVNDFPIKTFADFQSSLKPLFPKDKIVINTTTNSFPVILGSNPQNASIAYLGINAKQHLTQNKSFVEKYSFYIPPILRWLVGLFFWLFVLNLGIGLFNLLPLGPVDGGRMFQLVCLKFFKEKTAMKIWSKVSLLFVLLILFNLFAGFVV